MQHIGPSTVIKVPAASLASYKQAYPLAAFANQIVGAGDGGNRT